MSSFFASGGQPTLGKAFFVIGVATFFASGAILAKIAYESGSNALSVLTIRTIAAFLWLTLLLRLTGVRLRLPPPYQSRALALGGLLAIQTFGLYWAVEQMAPPLALITFCTYPIFIAAVEIFSGREQWQARRVLAMLLAFAGLVVTLNTGSLQPTLWGVLSATGGSLAFTAIIVLSQRLFPAGDSRPRTAQMSASASVIFLVACLLTGGFSVPTTASGWVGFWGVCITFPIALTGLFMSVQMLGPSRASVLLNFEPIAVTILSAIFLGQALTGLQLVGAAMVISAIAVLQWPPKKKQAAPN